MRKAGIMGTLLLAMTVLSPGGIVSPEPSRGQGPQPDPSAGDTPDCPVCRLWERYGDALMEADQEVGALEEGVIYFLYGENFRTIEELQRFAFERESLEKSGAARRHPTFTGSHQDADRPEVRLRLATSAHGFFAILTSPDPVVARALRERASRAVRDRIPPRF